MNERIQSCDLFHLNVETGGFVPSPEYERTVHTSQVKYGSTIQQICNLESLSYAFQMEFGDRLKAEREAAGMSQEKLGEGLGVSRPDATKQTVYGWENNKHFPTARQLALICKKLGKSADWLLFGEQPIEDMKNINGIEAQLVMMFRALKTGEQDSFLLLLKKKYSALFASHETSAETQKERESAIAQKSRRKVAEALFDSEINQLDGPNPTPEDRARAAQVNQAAKTADSYDPFKNAKSKT